jgi:hypothetical protein
MYIEEAAKIRENLVCFEGMISRKTHEYIWKVLVAPSTKKQLAEFALAIDPCRPHCSKTALKPYLSDDLSVYFFLKKDGKIVCMEYKEFLSLNGL